MIHTIYNLIVQTICYVKDNADSDGMLSSLHDKLS